MYIRVSQDKVKVVKNILTLTFWDIFIPKNGIYPSFDQKEVYEMFKNAS